MYIEAIVNSWNEAPQKKIFGRQMHILVAFIKKRDYVGGRVTTMNW